MNASAALQLALRALWRNKTRAMLTALGVVIGVAAVITMVAIGAGAQKRVAETLDNLGTNTLVIRPGTVTRGGVRTGAGGRTSLSLADAEAIDDLRGVVAVAPSIRAAGQVRNRDANWGTTIEGVTSTYTEVHNWTLAEGRFLTEQHMIGAAHVCVVGQTVARELFGLASPLGEHLLIKGTACEIIGVMAEKGATAWGTDQDDAVYMPITAVQRRLLGVTHVHRIDVATTGRAASFTLLADIKRLLRERHRPVEGQADDFRVYNRAELAESSEESARVFTWLLGSIASVSLLVGGIGIMNVMLVSVTERTREIGIRMALGARRRDILLQFLLEALLLSAVGGLFGIMVGIGGAVAVAHFSELSAIITPFSVLVAFLFAVLVGVFFGMHPARKAANLHPIEALRFE